MKIKLKEGEHLESHSSHQGFPVSVWRKLNSGEEVEVESIPDDAVNQVEETNNKKKKEVSNGK